MATANLHTVGTDPAAPSEGTLVGHAEVSPIGDSQAGVFPALLAWASPGLHRVFVYAAGGQGTPPEYIETDPTSITVTT